jgi:FtsP/CotA-like multicopper oxidase with cupredoxin domain
MKSLLFSRKFFLNLRTFSTILLVVLFSANSQAQCPTIDVIEDPQEFVWVYHPVTANNPEAYYSGTMEVGEVTLTLNNNETLTTRAYRQKGFEYTVPGPTLKMTPGNKYVLSLENTLPYEVPSTSHNVFKDPNIVNLHTHGLHISGMSPGDDVTRFFEGGRGGDFVYDIPADHMGGTFWYHAHHHGSTLLQVAGGMFGMLLIDDANDGIPANVANMEEKVLAIGFLDPGVQGTGGDTLISGSLSPSWTVNGIIGGNLCIPNNTWEHWRVLIADRGAKLRDVELGPGLEVMVLARDGVWRTTAPKELASNNNTLQLTGASRADFAIRKTGTGASWIKVGGVIVANIYTSNDSPDLTVNPYNTDGVSTWAATRPEYLRDLTNESNVNTESISMGARTVKGSNYGGKFDHMTPNVILGVTDVQEWSLSGNVQHPFHLHVYHVQAMSSDRDFEAGEYYDVVASQMDVRFDLNAATSTPYSGRTIMHCHILAHEDQGAMGWLDVQGGAAPPTFPINTTYSEYYILDGGTPLAPAVPSQLTAEEVSSSSINLTWLDNSGNEDGFNIERSTDGTNFSTLTAVGVNVAAYSDNGLTASTTYYYRVTAFNTVGNSAPSNVASATTQQSNGGIVMHVHSISVVRLNLNGNRSQAEAKITIYDSSNQPVSGATVVGNFTGPSSSSESGTTNTNGEVTFSTRALKNPVGIWCFEVTGVNLSGATYDAAANIITNACEGSTAKKSIPIAKKINNIGLNQYPNPFKNSAQITFQLPQQMHVILEIYTVLGKQVVVITDRNYEAGQYFIDWNAQTLAAGMYFLQMRADGKLIDTKKLILVH